MFLPAARRLAERQRHAALRVIERCGHVCNIEKPHVFNRISIDFMKDPVPAGVPPGAVWRRASDAG